MAHAGHVYWQNDAYYSQRKNSIARLSVPLSPNSCLLEASKDGKTARVGSLLARGASVSAKTTGEMTSLHFASEAGRVEVVEHLLERGANVHAKNLKGQTALFLACENAELNVIRVLLNYGAHVDAKDDSHESPLQALLTNNNEKGSRKGEILELLLQFHADVEASDSRGRTALHWACSSGEVEIGKLLLRYGANANARDNCKETALHIAARHEQSAASNGYKITDLMEYILQHGGQVNAVDNEGLTPLHSAAASGCAEVTQTLLRHKVDINAKTNIIRDTPLHLAARCGRREVCFILIYAGADLKLRNKCGETCEDLLNQAGIKVEFEPGGRRPVSVYYEDHTGRPGGASVGPSEDKLGKKTAALEELPEGACVLSRSFLEDILDAMSCQDEPAVGPPTSTPHVSIECAVCMDDLEEISGRDGHMMSTKCGHIFCETCINNALEREEKCPTCREILHRGSVHRIFLPSGTG